MKPYLDGTTEPFEAGDPVIYIPDHLLLGDSKDMILDENLGYVTSKNENFVFVLYYHTNASKTTLPSSLYRIDNRADLIAKLEQTMIIDKEFSDKLYSMKNGDYCDAEDDCVIHRVPGGWNYIYQLTTCCFVPFNSEFKDYDPVDF